MSNILSPIDLTKRPPRSCRCRLGGFVILPRIIDKGRATQLKTNGEYNYECPLDRHFFDFVAADSAAFKEEIKAGLGDGALLAWIQKNTHLSRLPHEIAQWSRFMEDRVPTDTGSREFFHEAHKAVAGQREDIGTWFDLLDLDDYTSFGGKV